jgi:hypothetical protein
MVHLTPLPTEILPAIQTQVKVGQKQAEQVHKVVAIRLTLTRVAKAAQEVEIR